MDASVSNALWLCLHPCTACNCLLEGKHCCGLHRLGCGFVPFFNVQPVCCSHAGHCCTFLECLDQLDNLINSPNCQHPTLFAVGTERVQFQW